MVLLEYELVGRIDPGKFDQVHADARATLQYGPRGMSGIFQRLEIILEKEVYNRDGADRFVPYDAS